MTTAKQNIINGYANELTHSALVSINNTMLLKDIIKFIELYKNREITKRYYEKNKEDILIKRKEYRKKQIESENIDEIKARQRESRIKYYNKKKLEKQQATQKNNSF